MHELQELFKDWKENGGNLAGLLVSWFKIQTGQVDVNARNIRPATAPQRIIGRKFWDPARQEYL